MYRFLVRDGVPFDKGLINIFEIQGALQPTTPQLSLLPWLGYVIHMIVGR